MKLIDVLQTIEWAMEHFGSLFTNSQCSRRDVMRAVKKGFVESIGSVVKCDDDGCAVQPEGYVEGFVLTEEGKEFLLRERLRVVKFLNFKIKGLNMLRFHNDQSVKQKYLDRVMAHAAVDEIVKGKYWKKGKGCE